VRCPGGQYPPAVSSGRGGRPECLAAGHSLALECLHDGVGRDNHLTCLRECGLVTATAEGRRVRYELANERLADALRILASLDLPGTCRE
jgi:hypothetical protein